MLESKGYAVDAPDLPGLGDDQTSLGSVTFQGYIDRVVRCITAQDGPVLLLGHSMGGATISQAAEVASESVAKLVYLAAILPRDAESVASILEIMPRFDEPSARGSMRPNASGDAFEFAAESVIGTFYNRCPPDIATSAAQRLRPQSAAPFASPVRLTPTRWGAIPKTYIVWSRDRAMSPTAQHWFCARVPGVKSLAMDADHSPFYSDPRMLAEIIDGEAR